MKLPSRIVDISSALDNDTLMDHPFMRPKVDYRTNVQNAPMLLESFPGLRQQDLPDGEGWAFELRWRLASRDVIQPRELLEL